MNGASGAPALGPAEPVGSSGARRPARGRSSSTHHPLATPAPRSQRSKSVWSRGGNVQVKKKKNCCKYSACKCSSCVSDPDCWIPVIQHLNFNDQTKTEFFKWSHLRHCLLYLLLTIAFTANNEFVTHGTTSTLYEFQTLLLQLVQSELVVLPLRTTTVYSEDCHCG